MIFKDRLQKLIALSKIAHSKNILDYAVNMSEDFDETMDQRLEAFEFRPETLIITTSSDLTTRSMSLKKETVCKYVRKSPCAFVQGPLKLFKATAKESSEILKQEINITTQIKDLQSKSKQDDSEIRRLNEKVEKLLDVIKGQKLNYEKELALQKFPKQCSKPLVDVSKSVPQELDLPDNIFDQIMLDLTEENQVEVVNKSPVYIDYSNIPRVPSKSIKKSLSLSEYKARKGREVDQSKIPVKKSCQGTSRR
jgi:hypothetical protein